MASHPIKQKPAKTRPDIWASGGQRPPFDLRAFGRAGLVLSREGVAPLLAWAARATRRAAVRVKDGAGRVPAEKLGRAARLVPSHQRVAGWIKTLAAVLSHASATADPDVTRGNALVAEIAPHLWDLTPGPAAPDTVPAVETPVGEAPPVVLAEPVPAAEDPLASIRDDLTGRQPNRSAEAQSPAGAPPAPPGAVAEGAIQVSGYLLGWATAVIALPYGLGRALWLWVKGRDLRLIGKGE